MVRQGLETRRVVAGVRPVLSLKLANQFALVDLPSPEQTLQPLRVQPMPTDCLALGSARQANRVPVQTKTTHRWSSSSACALSASAVLPESFERRIASGAFGSQVTPRSKTVTCSTMRSS